jgi:hypothetical protein
MKAIAIFQQNAFEINAAQNKILEGDTVIVPDEINETEDYLFCLQDVVRVWTRDNDSMVLVFSDGDSQRIMFEQHIWESIQNAIELRDKGFKG